MIASGTNSPPTKYRLSDSNKKVNIKFTEYDSFQESPSVMTVVKDWTATQFKGLF